MSKTSVTPLSLFPPSRVSRGKYVTSKCYHKGCQKPVVSSSTRKRNASVCDKQNDLEWAQALARGTVTSGHPIARERFWIRAYFRQGALLFNRTYQKKPTIIGYSPTQQTYQRQRAWLRSLLNRLPDELSITDKWVFLRLFVLCGDEAPMQFQLHSLARQTGVTHHTLTNPACNREGTLPHLRRLGLITYEHLNSRTTAIPLHMKRLEESEEEGV